MADDGYRLESLGDFHRIMVPHVLRIGGIGRDELVVDLGAAQGHCAVSARLGGYERVAAVDVDPENFATFASRYGIEGHLCDLEVGPLPFADGSVGAFISFHVIEHLLKPDAMLREAHRTLRPGGVIALVTPDWRKQYKTFFRDPTHIHPYDKTSVCRLLEIHGFQRVGVYSWGSRWGLGRLGAFRWRPRLGMIGVDLLALGFR